MQGQGMRLFYGLPTQVMQKKDRMQMKDRMQRRIDSADMQDACLRHRGR